MRWGWGLQIIQTPLSCGECKLKILSNLYICYIARYLVKKAPWVVVKVICPLSSRLGIHSSKGLMTKYRRQTVFTLLLPNHNSKFGTSLFGQTSNLNKSFLSCWDICLSASSNYLDYFKCKSQGHCIPREWLLDGKKQCRDGSDENKHDQELKRKHGRYLSLRNKKDRKDNSQLCIPPYIQCAQITNEDQQICAETCDEIRECKDSLDETYHRYRCSIPIGVSRLTATDNITSITSPNFPKNYDNDVIKVWFINVEYGFQLLIRFDHFQLESNCADHVILSLGSANERTVKVSQNKFPSSSEWSSIYFRKRSSLRYFLFNKSQYELLSQLQPRHL